jgi:hypothetical protein
MTPHHFYGQGMDTSSDIAEFESTRPSPLSETVPFFGPEIRSSTWPMSRNDSRDVGFYYNEGEYDGGGDDQIQDVELEASDFGSIEPCEYGKSTNVRLLTPDQVRFKPIEPPRNYTPLTFRPKILTRWILLAITVFYLANLGLLGYLTYRSRSAQVWNIHNVNYYLAARYLPAVIGVCTNILFLSTLSTLRRILPFIHMADQKNTTTKHRMEHTVCARYFPSTTRWTWLITFTQSATFVFQFTLAAKATLFDVEDTGHGIWLVSVRLGSAVFLGFTYLLAASTNVFIMIRYAGRNTGLKENWDPTSLADIILLFTPADTVPAVSHPLNSMDWYQMFRESKARYRLGYWKIIGTAESAPRVIYGIREIGTVTPTNSTRYLRRFNDYMVQKIPLTPCCRYSDRLEQLPDQPLVGYVCVSILLCLKSCRRLA